MSERLEILFHNIALQLLPLAEDNLRRAEEMHALGFRRHTHVIDYLKEPCTEEEWALSKQVIRETAKEMITCHQFACRPLFGATNGYKSELLERLRGERDKAGYDNKLFHSGGAEEWKFQLSPASRIVRAKEWNSTETDGNKLVGHAISELTPYLNEERQLILHEKYLELVNALNSAGVNAGLRAIPQKAQKHIKSFLHAELRTLGFDYKKNIRQTTCSQFVHALQDNFELRLYVRIWQRKIAWNLVICAPDYVNDMLCDTTGFLDRGRGTEYLLIDLKETVAYGFKFEQFECNEELVTSLAAFLEILRNEMPKLKLILKFNLNK